MTYHVIFSMELADESPDLMHPVEEASESG
jgi:hypothetical protein